MNSIVFRGIPHFPFIENLKLVRSWHHDEIIISTWDYVDIDKETLSLVDVVVRSKDPGENTNIANPSLRYASRQIVAANKGVEKASGDKILLSRTDVKHSFDRFSMVEKNNSESKYRVFSGKLIVGSVMSIDPYSNVEPHKERLFRICDWFQYGYKEDLMMFTDVEREVENNKHTGCCLEQLWFLTCFNKINKSINFDINNITIHTDECWETIIQNFRIINSVGMNTSKWIDKTNESIYIDEERYNRYAHA